MVKFTYPVPFEVFTLLLLSPPQLNITNNEPSLDFLVIDDRLLTLFWVVYDTTVILLSLLRV